MPCLTRLSLSFAVSHSKSGIRLRGSPLVWIDYHISIWLGSQHSPVVTNLQLCSLRFVQGNCTLRYQLAAASMSCTGASTHDITTTVSPLGLARRSACLACRIHGTAGAGGSVLRSRAAWTNRGHLPFTMRRDRSRCVAF